MRGRRNRTTHQNHEESVNVYAPSVNRVNKVNTVRQLAILHEPEPEHKQGICLSTWSQCLISGLLKCPSGGTVTTVFMRGSDVFRLVIQGRFNGLDDFIGAGAGGGAKTGYGLTVSANQKLGEVPLDHAAVVWVGAS